MTSPVSPSETIAKALEGVTHSEWFMSPWHVEEDASAVRNASDRSYICNASSDSFAAYIAACNPVAMREVLDELYALRKVVNAVLTWADQRCPCHNEEPNPCPLCGASVENLEPCKSAENTIPRHLLADLRRARTLIQGEKK